MNEAIERLRAQDGPLRYQVHTVIDPTGGVDATLHRGDVAEPLDIWTPNEAAWHKSIGSHAILAPSEEMSAALVVELITKWCRDNLGVDDVAFEHLSSELLDGES
ncbi:hypothetical protein LCD36_04705 [Saccharopolyspora sp. 6T]|uniref:hypothetical protein n=1 Tax=Saccharopolyspora sp. 6T TaxID=2877238 RepID=UPI001CD4173F|nr:hypothetical protein [Saccharopolyspora sp. 6T]MCA1185753.1 hypothetical protein [Saccharopolyspora sp. 6T]